MAQIMSTENALESKLLARDIVGYDEWKWKDVAYQECFKGIFEKFDQNENLKRVLVNTGNKTLVESSYDQIWGTGIPLTDPACLDKTKWYNPGIMSKLLMDICSQLSHGQREPRATEDELMDIATRQQE